jgi:uncharacterized protein (TIGR03086 family)
MQSDIAELHRRACEQVTTRVERIAAGQWDLPTPCTEWNVRDLVGHLVSGTSWVGPLVEGRTIAEVGDRFDGDLLGDDPSGAWRRAAGAAVDACAADGAMHRLVHLSSGDVPAADYVAERILDLVMHAWDVARAIGADETLDPELVDVARKVLAEKADLWRRHGALGPAVEPAPGADPQTLLLAESGRKVV